MKLKRMVYGACAAVAALGMLAGAATPGEDTCTTSTTCTDDEQVICIQLSEGTQQIELSKEICMQISKALSKSLGTHGGSPIVAKIMLSSEGDLKDGLLECLMECNEGLLTTCETACEDACDDDCIKACEEACGDDCDKDCEDGTAMVQAHSIVINADSMKIDDDDHEVKIMRRSGDDGDHIQLWVDGKEYKVGSDQDVHAILKKLGHGDVDLMVGPSKKLHVQKNVQVAKPMVMHKSKTLTLRGTGDGQMKVVSPGVIGTKGEPQERLMLKHLGQDQVQGMMAPPKAMLGVVLGPVADVLHDYLQLDEGTGVSVTQVLENTPAQKAGLQEGDIIVAITVGGKKDWKTVNEESFRGAIAKSEPGTVIAMKYLRAGKADMTKVKLGKWDPALMGGGMMGEADEKMMELHGLATPEDRKDGVWQWKAPDGEQEFQIVIEPDQMFGEEGMHEFRFELKPEHLDKMVEGFEFDEKQLKEHLRKALPNPGKPMKVQPIPGQYRELEEMMELLEQQMREMEKMFERMHQQQSEINQKLKKAKSLDA
ncbi:MAG: PDZ domain-containing protein [Planctomycetes bacterium]|nr:PDZ domain-containing protein [Planctomycetota bacterium]